MPRVYALLAHDADELLGRDGHRFWEALQACRADGLVAKVGASVYTPGQVDALLARYPLDAIQVPVNVLDQRLIRGGQLAALHAAGVEVFARSIFLQGVLLMDPETLPTFLTPVRPMLRGFRAELVARRLSPLQGALAFVLRRPEISQGVVGVCDAAQLQEILAAVTSPAADLPDCAPFHCPDATVVNPALCPKEST